MYHETWQSDLVIYHQNWSKNTIFRNQILQILCRYYVFYDREIDSGCLSDVFNRIFLGLLSERIFQSLKPKLLANAIKNERTAAFIKHPKTSSRKRESECKTFQQIFYKKTKPFFCLRFFILLGSKTKFFSRIIYKVRFEPKPKLALEIAIPCSRICIEWTNYVE